MAHLDTFGNPIWGLWTVEGSMGYTTLKAFPPDNAVYAKIEGLANEQDWTVFGLFNAQDGTRLFERGVSVKVQEYHGVKVVYPTISADHLSDGRSTVLLDYYNESRVELAVLDRAGQIQWQRSFAAPSFAIAGTGEIPALIEDPGKGFWLVLSGSQPITTAPNPPVYNHNLTLNVIRLSSQGEVLSSNRAYRPDYQ